MILFTANAVAQGGPSYYAFAGAGGSTGTFGRTMSLAHAGGGAEFIAQNGLGAGAEIGYLTPWSNGSNGVGVMSLNGLYRFGANQKTMPFFTGGYSLGFRSQAAHFGNVGGGITYWFAERTGLRLEFRDNIRDFSTHWLIFRVGIAFR
jgi:hypothetical protein